MMEFDSFDPVLHHDPYPVYRRLRDESPSTTTRTASSTDRMAQSLVERHRSGPIRGALRLPIAES